MSKIIYEIELIDGDNIKYYYANDKEIIIILYEININFTNPKTALHNIISFCEKIGKLNTKIRYIQHYADYTEYTNNVELYNKFHIEKNFDNTSICLTASLDDFPEAFWQCIGWKDN
jgi:hypothetical protein